MHDVLNAAAKGWVRAQIQNCFVDIRNENASAFAPLYVGPKDPAFRNMPRVKRGASYGQLRPPNAIGGANEKGLKYLFCEIPVFGRTPAANICSTKGSRDEHPRVGNDLLLRHCARWHDCVGAPANAPQETLSCPSGELLRRTLSVPTEHCLCCGDVH